MKRQKTIVFVIIMITFLGTINLLVGLKNQITSKSQQFDTSSKSISIEQEAELKDKQNNAVKMSLAKVSYSSPSNQIW